MPDVKLWWLSFCDPYKPAGSQFLGACLVRAPDMIAAITRAHALGINPGGEVQGLEVPPQTPAKEALIAPRVERLMSRGECEAFDRLLLEAVS